MTIKVQNTAVIDDKHLQNINNFRTINGISLIGDGDLGVIADLTAIKSIHGRSITGSGDFKISKSDIGLSNVDNTSDVNKPISIATQPTPTTSSSCAMSKLEPSYLMLRAIWWIQNKNKRFLIL